MSQEAIYKYDLDMTMRAIVGNSIWGVAALKELCRDLKKIKTKELYKYYPCENYESFEEFCTRKLNINFHLVEKLISNYEKIDESVLKDETISALEKTIKFLIS